MKACGWSYPRAPRISTLFGEERATPPVLAFLRDTKVDAFISLAALGGGVDVDEVEPVEDGGASPHRMYFCFVFSLVRQFLSFSYSGSRGAGD